MSDMFEFRPKEFEPIPTLRRIIFLYFYKYMGFNGETSQKHTDEYIRQMKVEMAEKLHSIELDLLKYREDQNIKNE